MMSVLPQDPEERRKYVEQQREEFQRIREKLT